MACVPETFAWVFWDVDPATLDTEKHAGYILPRILESGGLNEVRWAIAQYGQGGIHRFLKETGHPELSPRTVQFWKTVLGASEEEWTNRRRQRLSSVAPWIN